MAILACFVVAPLFMVFEQVMFSGPWASAAVMAGAVAVSWGCLALTERAPFGLVLRWALVLTGSVLVFVPTIAEASPMVACALCSGIYVLVGTLMIVFILEICQEQGLTLCTVTTSNYGVFVLGVCGASALLSLLLAVTGKLEAFRIITATGVAALFLIIPMLPARISRAQDLVLEKLPEEESADERRNRVCAALAAQGNLSEREAEVLDLLLRGRTREEIAEELVISTWTVKNHASSVYGKLGVHSARELTALVENPKR